MMSKLEKVSAVRPYLTASTPLGAVRLGGEIGSRLDRFFRHRIFNATERDAVMDEALGAFRNQIDDISGVVGIWQGEFWGKLMISAARAARYSKEVDPGLMASIRRSVDELLKLQRPDGYIGTYRNPEFVRVTDTEGARRVMGWDCVWNWNIWCRKYTLWGLLEAYALLGDRRILDSCARFTDQLFAMLDRLGLSLRDTGTFSGIPSCSILKPLLLLYEYTANKAYLERAVAIADNWERADGGVPNLISNSLSDRPVHLWYDHTKGWAKVYEMLSCFDGLLELYRMTGVERYLKAALMFHEKLRNHEKNPQGSVGFNDLFRHGGAYLNGISEPCDAIHWMRFCGELYKLTGDNCCLDDFEECFFNAFLAGVFRDGHWGARGVRTSGRHMVALSQAKFILNHCCVDNMPRGLLNLAELCAVRTSGGVKINFYCDFTAELDGIDLDVAWDWRGPVVVRTASREAFKLELRVPGWSRRATAVLSGVGARIEASDGDTVLILTIPAGKAVVELDLHLTLAVDNRGVGEELSEWHMRRLCKEGDRTVIPERVLRKTPAALLHWGPLLLARSKFIGSTEAEMFSNPMTPDVAEPWQLKSGASAAGFLFSGWLTAGKWQTPVCDYASAANALLGDDSFFSVFFEPGKSGC